MRKISLLLPLTLLTIILPMATGCSKDKNMDVKTMSQDDKKKFFGDPSKLPADYRDQQRLAGEKAMAADKARFATPPPGAAQ